MLKKKGITKQMPTKKNVSGKQNFLMNRTNTTHKKRTDKKSAHQIKIETNIK